MQTPHNKAPAGIGTRNPLAVTVMELTTTPPCSRPPVLCLLIWLKAHFGLFCQSSHFFKGSLTFAFPKIDQKLVIVFFQYTYCRVKMVSLSWLWCTMRLSSQTVNWVCWCLTLQQCQPDRSSWSSSASLERFILPFLFFNKQLVHSWCFRSERLTKCQLVLLADDLSHLRCSLFLPSKPCPYVTTFVRSIGQRNETESVLYVLWRPCRCVRVCVAWWGFRKQTEAVCLLMDHRWL